MGEGHPLHGLLPTSSRRAVSPIRLPEQGSASFLRPQSGGLSSPSDPKTMLRPPLRLQSRALPPSQTLEQKCASPKTPRVEFCLSSQATEQGTPFPQTLVQGSAPTSDPWASATGHKATSGGLFLQAPWGPLWPVSCEQNLNKVLPSQGI